MVSRRPSNIELVKLHGAALCPRSGDVVVSVIRENASIDRFRFSDLDAQTLVKLVMHKVEKAPKIRNQVPPQVKYENGIAKVIS